MADIVSEKYAASLFQVGLEEKIQKDLERGLDYIKEAFKSGEGLDLILRHPAIGRDEKKDLVERIFKGSIREELVNFIFVLIDNKRIASLEDILAAYEEIYNQYENIERVLAITAVEMDKKTKKALEKSLGRKLNKKIKLENKIDPGIIGGAILRYGNKYIDGSLAGQLESMRKAIMGWENETKA